LIFLPLPIPLAQFAALPMEQMAGHPMSPLTSVQLDLNPPPVMFIVNIVEHGERFRDTTKLGNGTRQRGGAAAALQRLDQGEACTVPTLSEPAARKISCLPPLACRLIFPLLLPL
jgi:hypothetical protein